MDTLYVLHLAIFAFIFSIAVWPISYLRYGVYIPLIISMIWFVNNGCPITKMQTNLHGNSFTKDVYKNFMPQITEDEVQNINTFALLSITAIGFTRLLKQQG